MGERGAIGTRGSSRISVAHHSRLSIAEDPQGLQARDARKVVQKGIERMGGRVGVESTPGQGSRFWFELRKVPEV